MFDAVTDFLPQEGWLGDYLNFTNNLEACPRFKFFSAVCALGAAVNNRVWLQRGSTGLLPPLMPNLWVTLLAPPYRGHKTSTINMAVNCLVEAFPEARILPCADLRLLSNTHHFLLIGWECYMLESPK